MEFYVEEAQQKVLSGMAREYQVEVAHGGWGGQIGDRMLVSTIVRIVKRMGDDPNKWEATETIHLSLDRDAAKWLSDALGK
jgi:hypothetical protein